MSSPVSYLSQAPALPARDKAFTKRNITAAWAASGLFPFNPDRVLKTILKPLAQITIPHADEVGSCLQDEVLNSPVTPVSAEALTSLHNLIKQDQSSTQRQQRHVQKLANAAQMSFAEVALLRDQKQSLITIANESKVRRSTKSIVVGKAKVMSYEDIVKARADRAAKDIMKGKGKRGRKRKALEACEQELEPEVAHAAKEVKNGNGKRSGKRKSAVPEADEPEPEPQPELARMTAPVARMIGAGYEGCLEASPSTHCQHIQKKQYSSTGILSLCIPELYTLHPLPSTFFQRIDSTSISVDMPNDKAFEDGQQLLKLKQTETTRAYISDFRALASGVSWNDAALKSFFYRGLSDEVKDIICYKDEPNTLEEYIQMAQDIDNRLLEREEKRMASRQSARRVG
ncbi:hypothetical protein V502_01230 [Pseudogymnoascus sp. VKM F-4520 (FW-2644)]|nr:hypothetical protein V502_01230 [Pseudogymnoascus sp. VKM F-4520 (FW-2644)]